MEHRNSQWWRSINRIGRYNSSGILTVPPNFIRTIRLFVYRNYPLDIQSDMPHHSPLFSQVLMVEILAISSTCRDRGQMM